MDISLILEKNQVSESNIERLMCCLEWLQKALTNAIEEKSMELINSLVRAYLDIARHYLNSPATTGLIEFGIKLSKYAPKQHNELHVEWWMLLFMTLSYYIASKRHDSLSLDADKGLKLQIIRGSNMAKKFPLTRSIYMKILVSIIKRYTLPKEIMDEFKLSFICRIYKPKSKSEAVSLLEDFKNLKSLNTSKVDLRSFKLDDVGLYVDNLFLLTEMARQVLAKDALDIAREYLHMIDIAVDSYIPRDMDLLIKFCKEEYYIRSTTVKGDKPYERLAKIIYQASKIHCHDLVLECSIHYWNMIYPTLTEQQSPTLIHAFELILKSLDGVLTFSDQLKQLKSLYAFEISRYYNQNQYLIPLEQRALVTVLTVQDENHSVEKGAQ
jgi:hypothetical protein